MATRAPSRLRTVFRWLRRLALALAVLVVVLLLVVGAGLVWLTRSDAGHALIVREALTILNRDVLIADASIGALGGDLLRTIELTDVIVRDADGNDAISVGLLRVEWSPTALLRRHVAVESVVIDDVDVRARIEQDGTMNLAALLQPTEPRPPNPDAAAWTVGIDAVAIDRARFSLRDARNDDARLVIVRGLTVRGAVQIGADGVIDVSVPALNAAFSTPVIETAALDIGLGDVTVQSRADGLDVAVTSLFVEGTEVNNLAVALSYAEGAMFQSLSGGFDAVKLSARDLNTAIGADILAVPVGLVATVAGTPDDLRLNVAISGPGEAIRTVLRLDISEPADPGYSLRADIVRFVPAAWLAVDVPDADVSVGVAIDGHGITPESAHGSIVLDIGPSQVMGWGVDGGAVSATYEDGAARINRLTAWTTGVEVDANATAALDGAFSVEAGVSLTDLSMLAEFSPLTTSAAGRVDVHLNASGVVPIDDLASLADLPPLEAAEALLGNVQLELSVDGRSLRFGEYRAGDIEVAATVPASERLTINANVDVRDVVVPGVPTIASGSLEARYVAERLTISVAARDVDGRDAHVDAAIEQIEAGARVDLARLDVGAGAVSLRLAEPSSVDVLLDEDLAFTGVETRPLRLMVGDSAVNVQAEYHTDGRVEATADSKQVDLALLGSLLVPELGLAGMLDFELGIHDTLARPRFTFAGSLIGGAVDDVRDVDVHAALAVSGDVVDAKIGVEYGGVPVLVVDTGAAGVPLSLDLESGAADLDWDAPIAVSAKIPSVSIPDILARWPSLDVPLREGTLAGSFTVAGTASNPNISARLAVTRAQVDAPLGDETWPVGPVDGTLMLGFDGTNTHALDVRLDATLAGERLANVSVTVPLDLVGLMRGELAADAWWADASAQVAASVGPVDVGVLPESLRDAMGVSAGSGELRATWSGGATDGALMVELIGNAVVVGGLPPVGARLRVESTDHTQVLVRAGAGNVENVGRMIYARAFDDVVAVFDSDTAPDDWAAAELTLDLEQGWYALLDEGPDVEGAIDMRLNLAGVPTGLFVEVAQDETPLAGLVRGYIDLGGTPRSPALFGRIAARDVSLGADQSGTLTAQLAFDGTHMRVDGGLCSDAGDSVALTALADIAAPLIDESWGVTLPDFASLPIDIRVQAEGAQLASVLPRFATSSLVEDVEGTLDVDLHVSGTPRVPRFEGALTIADGAMGIIPLGRSFEGIEARMTLAQEGLVIDRVVVRDGTGRLLLSGMVGLTDLRPSDISISFDMREFLVADPTGAGVFIDGDVTFDGRMTGERMDAEVELANLVVTIPESGTTVSGGPTTLPEFVYFVDEDVDVSQVGQRRPERMGAEAPAEPSDFEAHVHVGTRGRNVVEHSLADVQFTADLDVSVDDQDFRLSGVVELPRGRVTFAGKPFELTRGFITFDGRPSEVDPAIDVRAAHTLSPSVAERLPAPSSGEATVQVVVDGLLSELFDSEADGIRLQSDPEMSRQDILYVLLTGRPRDDAADATADQQALATASSLLLGLLGDRLAGDLPIDTLRIEGDSQSGQAIARVEGGKYIAEDLYVAGTYINSQDPEDNDFEFAIQWIIARIGSASIRTELRMGNRRKGGLELLYSITRAGRRRAEPDPE